MIRLYVTLACVLVMGCLIPLAPEMAVSQDSPPYTLFVYQFGHASLLHWLINGWALLVLHNILKPSRLIVAYGMSVIVPFLQLLVQADTPPILGASVITCFFFGFLSPYLWRSGEKLTAAMMMALVIIGFFIPGIAALPHLVMFLSGMTWHLAERLHSSFSQFINR